MTDAQKDGFFVTHVLDSETWCTCFPASCPKRLDTLCYSERDLEQIKREYPHMKLVRDSRFSSEGRKE